MWIFIRVSTNSYIKASARALGEATPGAPAGTRTQEIPTLKVWCLTNLATGTFKPHGILGGHAATHPQQIAGVSSLLELVSSIINITLQVGRYTTWQSQEERKRLAFALVERAVVETTSFDYQSKILTC